MNTGFEENQGCRGRQAVMHIRVSGAHQADYSPSDQRALLMDKAARRLDRDGLRRRSVTE